MYIKPLTIPWFKIIFAQFENESLKRALQKCAQEIDCKVWYAEERSVDIFNIPHFIAVLEWPLWGTYLSEMYLRHCEETNNNAPWVMIKKSEAQPLPVMKITKLKKCLYVDTIDYDSINKMIAFIKEIKSNLKEKSCEN